MPIPRVFGTEDELVLHVQSEESWYKKWRKETMLACALLERFCIRFFSGVNIYHDYSAPEEKQEMSSLDKFKLYGQNFSSEAPAPAENSRSEKKSGKGEDDDEDEDEKGPARYFGSGFMTPLGGRFYIDHGYLETSSPECDDPFTLLAANIAHEELIAEEFTALFADHPLRPRLYKNVSDGQGHSQASHRNFCVRAEFWPNLVSRWDMKSVLFGERCHTGLSRPTHILETLHAVEQILDGAGKWGDEDMSYDRRKTRGTQDPLSIFKISGRADFTEVDVGEQTTNCRPLVNTRYEPLAAPEKYSRYHCISGDANRAEWSNLFRIWLPAMVIGMMEDDFCGMDFYVSEPVRAVKDISLDTTCKLPVKISRFSNGSASALSPLEIMKAFLAEIKRYISSRSVPEWCGIIYDKAEWAVWALENEPALLESVLDWKIKERITLGAKNAFGRHLNYHALAGPNLLYRRLCQDGDVETVIPREQIEKYKLGPPETTRAYFRGSFLKRFHKDVEFFLTDWCEIVFRREGAFKRIRTPEPLKLTKKEWGHIFEREDAVSLESFKNLVEPCLYSRIKEGKNL